MTDLVERGYQAKSILDFRAVWEFLEKETSDALFNSPYNDTDAREKEFFRYVALKDLQSVLNGMYENAVAIQKRNTVDTNNAGG